MNREALAKQLRIDEGIRLLAYKDSRGFWTVGVGHLLAQLGHDGMQITHVEVERLLDEDISKALMGCIKIWPNFDKLPEEAQQVLCNMCFNLGEFHLKLFVSMIDAVKKQQWLRVAHEMRTSRWHEQVGARADRLIARIMALVPPSPHKGEM